MYREPLVDYFIEAEPKTIKIVRDGFVNYLNFI